MVHFVSAGLCSGAQLFGHVPVYKYSYGTDAEAETPMLWSPDVKHWLIGKDPDAGKD